MLPKVTFYDKCVIFNLKSVVFAANFQISSDLMKGGRIKDPVWIGLKTQSASSSSRLPFSNFNKDSPIDGCAGEQPTIFSVNAPFQTLK
uniref:Ovule protein n=1 Tax=Angiostrongylus cantonensis TaxID=6313 RepID=A0A0K0D541_ANGCA